MEPHKRFAIVVLAICMIFLVSCGSKYREYGFTGVYYRNGSFTFGEGDYVIAGEVEFGENRHTLDALKGTKSFDILGETITCEYECTYTYSYTSEPIHCYKEIGPNGHTGLYIKTYSRDIIHELGVPNNHKLITYDKYMYECEAILDFAKKYVGKINPSINLDEFELLYYGDSEIDNGFDFFWKKCVSGVTMEFLEVYVDMFGNLGYFKHSVCDATHTPEVSEAQLLEIAEEKMRDTLEKEGYEVSCFKDTRIPRKYNSSNGHLMVGTSEDLTYEVIYYKPLASYALWFDVDSTVVLEDGREDNVFLDMFLTFK